MRDYIGNLVLQLSEKILGRSACFIYTRKRYPGQRKDGYIGKSPFLQEKPIEEYSYHIVVHNKYPYKGFSQHFLIVPKREVRTLSEFNSAEQQELVQIMGIYEAQGFISLSQQFGVSKAGSVAHKHVHVLK